jgi:hypothetical protein
MISKSTSFTVYVYPCLSPSYCSSLVIAFFGVCEGFTPLSLMFEAAAALTLAVVLFDLLLLP